ncbi:uncharacterized protein ColSpa_06460 [Colletotrichum spaethianum]|uniref:Uncharacterized protein n=1 Tax=Colletotrichum spaethianum TaxID=700344 RepID=A0AA37P7Y1_9PEZI|nr:uncharacterized protein ColSpa_06460 [Colletotrichum spaethianum]GKT46279.1 hypothetical protein ColSpa_06460 [Colletotrichum spaethianum]
MQTDLDPRVLQALEGFQKSKITIIEWETPLLSRLGYPLASKLDLIFLIPDDQLQSANNITAASSQRLAYQSDHSPAYLSEFANQGFRYVLGDLMHRFILLPLSWTGIDQDELEVIPTPKHHLPSGTIFTVPLPAFCAAYLRIIIQESSGSRALVKAIADLSSVIAYNMFDMSYSGDYMINPEDDMYDEAIPLPEGGEKGIAKAEKDALEIKIALGRIQEWSFKKDDEWTRDILLRLVSGKLRYEDLPSK